MGEYGQAQSRARGLTRAILDTFPVIKFSRSPVEPASGGDAFPKPSDEESGSLEMDELPHGNGPADAPVPAGERPVAPAVNANMRRSTHDDVPTSPGAGSSTDASVMAPIAAAAMPSAIETTTPQTARTQAASEDNVDSPGVLPSAIGRETCPICILDFEDGDDIRVLPCEGHHVFHQACVDPWLLELSSSCPICRHGEYMRLDIYMRRIKY